MTSGAADAWAAASFVGAERRLREAVAAATPERRMSWLEEALQLAQASGALARARHARQEEIEQLWR